MATVFSPSVGQVHGWISLNAPCSWHAKNLKCGLFGWAGFLLVSKLNRQDSSAAREAVSGPWLRLEMPFCFSPLGLANSCLLTGLSGTECSRSSRTLAREIHDQFFPKVALTPGVPVSSSLGAIDKYLLKELGTQSIFWIAYLLGNILMWWKVWLKRSSSEPGLQSLDAFLSMLLLSSGWPCRRLDGMEPYGRVLGWGGVGELGRLADSISFQEPPCERPLTRHVIHIIHFICTAVSSGGKEALL